MQPTISPYEACQLGLSRYFTGKPCKHGHLCERYVFNNTCVECSRDRYEASAAPARIARAAARLAKQEAIERRRAERQAERERRREEMALRRAAKREVLMRPIEHVCRHCSRPFIDSPRTIYCSDACRDEVNRAGIRAWKRANPEKRKAQHLRASIRNPQRNRDRVQRWMENNPERRKANLFASGARRKKARAVFDELAKTNPALHDALPSTGDRGSAMLNALKAIGIEVHI